MSVILYSKDELVNMLAASWFHGSPASSEGKRRLERYAEMGNRIADANGAAFTETYNEAVEPFTILAQDINRALIAKTVQSQADGYRTLRGIRYNLVANNGADFASVEVLDDLVALYGAVTDRLAPK